MPPTAAASTPNARVASPTASRARRARSPIAPAKRGAVGSSAVARAGASQGASRVRGAMSDSLFPDLFSFDDAPVVPASKPATVPADEPGPAPERPQKSRRSIDLLKGLNPPQRE